MKIAVITGASAGLGVQYGLKVDALRPDIDEIWLVARREERLKEAAQKLNKPTVTVPLDITDRNAVNMCAEKIRESGKEVALLINNAGFGKIGNFDSLKAEDNADTVRLNCEGLTYFTAAMLPFMKEKSEIINICSIAAFAPNSRMAVYSSTKAYVMSFSRALRDELKSRKINVLAVCPGPMETEFFSVAGIKKGTSHTFDTLPRVNPASVAEKSLAASKKGKAVYTNRLFYKFYRLVAKVLPTGLVIKMCRT